MISCCVEPCKATPAEDMRRLTYWQFKYLYERARDEENISEERWKQIDRLVAAVSGQNGLSNRTVTGIEQYVSTFCACGGEEEIALDRAMESRLVLPLEGVYERSHTAEDMTPGGQLDGVFGEDSVPSAYRLAKWIEAGEEMEQEQEDEQEDEVTETARISNETSDETPEEIPEETPGETPEVTPEETLNEIPEETTEETTEETPEETFDEIPEELPEEALDENNDEASNDDFAKLFGGLSDEKRDDSDEELDRAFADDLAKLFGGFSQKKREEEPEDPVEPEDPMEATLGYTSDEDAGETVEGFLDDALYGSFGELFDGTSAEDPAEDASQADTTPTDAQTETQV